MRRKSIHFISVQQKLANDIDWLINSSLHWTTVHLSASLKWHHLCSLLMQPHCQRAQTTRGKSDTTGHTTVGAGHKVSVCQIITEGSAKVEHKKPGTSPPPLLNTMCVSFPFIFIWSHLARSHMARREELVKPKWQPGRLALFIQLWLIVKDEPCKLRLKKNTDMPCCQGISNLRDANLNGPFIQAIGCCFYHEKSNSICC